MQEQAERVVVGMDPHKRSFTVEVMSADETILGGGRHDTDSGWNCWTEQGATVSSFDSTICVLEGLLEYELSGEGKPWPRRAGGEKYLLERQLFRRKSTGEVPAERWLQFSWPPRWHYDVLRALDYFRRTGGASDGRVAEAMQQVRDKRSQTAPGCLRAPTRARPSSSSRTATGAPADGTRCGRCASSAGTTASVEPVTVRQAPSVWLGSGADPKVV